MLIQIAPPGDGGVRDYVERLRDAWQGLGIASHVVVLSKSLTAGHSLAERLAMLGASEERPCSVVLHFSGYGYARRGVCLWLLDELRALRAQLGPRLRLLVVFHELAAAGPPWRSAFWVSPLHKLIARRLARQADAVWTNTQVHASWLCRARGSASAQVSVWPVFSNVGEAGDVAPLTHRLPHAVVFGSPSTRARAFRRLHGHERTLRALGIEELVEIGAGASADVPSPALRCRRLGPLDGDRVAQWLQRSRFGVLDYPPHLLGKSGVFAAYAAHGCTVLNTWPTGSGSDDLKLGVDFLGLATDAAATMEPAPMAARLLAWYRTHGVAIQARAMLTLAQP